MTATLAAVRHAGRMAPLSRLLALLLLLPALIGCGGAPEKIGPTGVDGLEIPTPSPDPDDYVAEVDNPYLPLPRGATWGYRVDDDDAVARRVTVTDDTRLVAGIETTVVRVLETSRLGAIMTDTYAWYAQDRAGNVWLFGQDVRTATPGGGATREGRRLSWEAGVDGAQAGLAMPAEPRRGDGYRLGLAPGVFEARAEVLSLEEEREVTGSAYDDLLVVEITTPLDPGLVVRRSYAEGTGLVLAETVSGESRTVELVRFDSTCDDDAC